MRVGFYAKLAWEGIRKNKRLYAPYILTGVVMVMMYYIIYCLAGMEMLKYMRGGRMLQTILPLGASSIAVFSSIFLFYSNSLLIRQRNREFGLYNILGMDKKNLGRIMLWENLMVAAISMVSGLLLGIGLSKMAELCLMNLINGEITYTFQLDWAIVIKTIGLFMGIYFILLLNSVIKVRCSNPVELLHSSNVGEKPPKANWLFAVVGVLLLAVAYYIAVSIKQPLTALTWFLLAVVMVIIATYLLFVSGSVVLCRILQKNKRYYYKPQHFVSVSSMSYRMKRNGAGLASICILVTMVLVMLSATTSLYVGAEDSLNCRYPRDIGLRVSLPDIEYINEGKISHMRKALCDRIPKQQEVMEYISAEIPGLFTEEGIIVDAESLAEYDYYTYENVGILSIITLEDYNRLMGTNETLEEGECFLYGIRIKYLGDTFSIENGPALKVKKVLEEMHIAGYATIQLVPTIILVTGDFEKVVEPLLLLKDERFGSLLELGWNYNFDMDADSEEQIAAYEQLCEEIRNIIISAEDGSYSYMLEGKESGRADFYGMYAGLFFIGIFLSIVLLFAAVVIIYYKQISEGYEDQKRFEVMQKVGMTQKDIKKSINSQVLTVFFIPLVLAGIHLSFAFPIVWRLLQLFNFSNLPLMIAITLSCFLVFAGVYALVYKITSNAYYTIVSDTKDGEA